MVGQMETRSRMVGVIPPDPTPHLPNRAGCWRLVERFWDDIHADLRKGHKRTHQWINNSPNFIRWCNVGIQVDPVELRERLNLIYDRRLRRRRAERREILADATGEIDVPDEEELARLFDEWADEEAMEYDDLGKDDGDDDDDDLDD
jgi:hypothetical protein